MLLLRPLLKSTWPSKHSFIIVDLTRTFTKTIISILRSEHLDGALIIGGCKEKIGGMQGYNFVMSWMMHNSTGWQELARALNVELSLLAWSMPHGQ